MALNRRIRDISLSLPILGAFLLISPFARIFDSAERLWGIPLVAFYVFAVWLGLILIAIGLARHLSGEEEDGPETESRAAEPGVSSGAARQVAPVPPPPTEPRPPDNGDEGAARPPGSG